MSIDPAIEAATATGIELAEQLIASIDPAVEGVAMTVLFGAWLRLSESLIAHERPSPDELLEHLVKIEQMINARDAS